MIVDDFQSDVWSSLFVCLFFYFIFVFVADMMSCGP